jgi:hypothetical protein
MGMKVPGGSATNERHDSEEDQEDPHAQQCSATGEKMKWGQTPSSEVEEFPD